MFRSLSTNLTGIQAYQQSLEQISNNISNVNTIAYKGKQVSFSDLIYRELRARRVHVAPAEGELEPQAGKGVRVSSAATSFIQGTLSQSDRALDLAIEGDGFFRIIRPDGSVAYTRSGSFHMDPYGNILTAQGDFLDTPFNLTDLTGGGEDAEVPPGELFVSVEGLAYWDNGDGEPLGLGQFNLYKFVNANGLLTENGVRFIETEASGAPIQGIPGEEGFGSIMQKYIELSNADLSTELVNMLITQRALQANIRALMTSDELWAYTIQAKS